MDVNIQTLGTRPENNFQRQAHCRFSLQRTGPRIEGFPPGIDSFVLSQSTSPQGPAPQLTRVWALRRCNCLKGQDCVAEREGFEPSVRANVRLISSQVQSTTLPPLRCLARMAWPPGRPRLYAASPSRASPVRAMRDHHPWAGRRTRHFRGPRTGSARTAAPAKSAHRWPTAPVTSKPRGTAAVLPAGGCCPAGH